MSSYCLKCSQNTESKSQKIARTNNGRLILLSKCKKCGRKNSKIIK